jgi:hypothetical protein
VVGTWERPVGKTLKGKVNESGEKSCGKMGAENVNGVRKSDSGGPTGHKLAPGVSTITVTGWKERGRARKKTGRLNLPGGVLFRMPWHSGRTK